MRFRRGGKAELAQFLAQNPVVALDTETTGLNPRRDTLLDVVVANQSEALLLSPVDLYPLIGCGNEFIMHNAKFDLAVLYHNGVNLCNNVVWDTMLLDHLRNENDPHGLDYIVQSRYNDNYKEVFWAEYDSYEEAHPADKLSYACKDAIYTYRLYYDLARDLSVPRALIMHVHRLARALLDTELRGIRLDTVYAQALSDKLSLAIQGTLTAARSSAQLDVEELELNYWEREINKRKMVRSRQAIRKPEFNFASNTQLQDLLYGKLNLPKQYNKKRKLTVDDAALTKISGKHPVVPLIKELRDLNKVLGTYVVGAIERAEEGRIYPSFKINGTVTGRISSENPNLQNLPRDGDVRGLYLPDGGFKLIGADFSSLEVVIEAHYSQDKNLLRIVNEGVSKHDITAQALGIDRTSAKTLNFAMQYRCGVYKVAQLLKISQSEAELIFNKYWETYGGANRLFKECCALVDAGKPIVSIFGRTRTLPSKFDVEWKREAAYREAYSALIQGTGADVTHRAFYEVYAKLLQEGVGNALFEVHDEIIAQAKIGSEDRALEILTTIMNAAGGNCGLTVALKCAATKPMDRWAK